MKLRELAKAANVPKDTIHFYIREGLLPKPRKRSRNVAEYDESYVERIRYIKDLQDNHFLPLSVIKRVIRHQEKGSPDRLFAQLQSEYFRAVDRLLPQRIEGEEAFRKVTGLGPIWLARMEEWGVLTPETVEGRKFYSQDDVALGKVIVDMDRLGLGPKDGFDPESLRFYKDMFREIVALSTQYYARAANQRLSADDVLQLAEATREVMCIFFYYLHRKLSREEFLRQYGAKGPDAGRQPEEGPASRNTDERG